MSAGGKRREEFFFDLWKFYPAKALEHRAFQAIAAPAFRRLSQRERTPATVFGARSHRAEHGPATPRGVGNGMSSQSVSAVMPTGAGRQA